MARRYDGLQSFTGKTVIHLLQIYIEQCEAVSSVVELLAHSRVLFESRSREDNDVRTILQSQLDRIEAL